MSPATKPKPQHGQCRHIAGEWTTNGPDWEREVRKCLRCGRRMEMRIAAAYQWSTMG